MKKIILSLLTVLMLMGLVACGNKTTETVQTTSSAKESYPNAKLISLIDGKVTIDGVAVEEYDYTWVYDPSMEEPTYEGTEPNTSTNYIAHDIIYYPEIDTSNFAKEEYDGEFEWVTHFTNAGLTDYLFGTLPVLGEDIPTEMMHSKEEAYENPVLHIVEPGEYILEGNWKGQILVDLGEEAFSDETKKVTFILNGVSVDCDVAPAIVFKNVYECDNAWEDRQEAISTVDLTNAGVKVILVDGKDNNFEGANVYRLLKPKYKDEEKKGAQKKLYKTDGAFYSFVSMLIQGNTGILNITSSTFEGLDTELHLTIDGGYINIVSQDDGINVNEDDVSIFTMKNGRLTIFAGQGAEGDVIDSNGYINVDGGTLLGTSPSVSDNALDSDAGTNVSDNAKVISSLTSMGGQGGPGDMTSPGGFGGERPEGFNGQMKDGQTPPEMPNGQNPFDGNASATQQNETNKK